MESAYGKKRRPRRVVRPGTEQGPVPGLSRDERGDDEIESAATSSLDEQIKREVPPHWEPSQRY